jgi:serine/threonine-protein kinase
MGSRQLASGTIVAGKYRLFERLGGGGMGDVYRAEHTFAGRVVAMKLLRSEYADDADLTRRFFQEAQAANRIRHPNIVDVLDAGFSEQGPYVAMEYLEGTSLSGALARLGRIEVPVAIAVILPVLDALDAAHRHGIVHRDLKPENVFLSNAPNGEVQVKILDFGIAKVEDGPAGSVRPRTHTGIIFGTPDYLSPEQANGEGPVDGRSDVFSAGIVLFELVTGRRPFQAKSAVATAYRIVHEPTPRLEDAGVHAHPVLQQALDLALAKSLEDRCSTAAAFADSLAPLAPDGPTRRLALRHLLDAVIGASPTPLAPGSIQAQPTAVASPLPISEPAAVPPRPAAGPATPTLVSTGVASSLLERGSIVERLAPQSPHVTPPVESHAAVREPMRPRAPPQPDATPRPPSLVSSSAQPPGAVHSAPGPGRSRVPWSPRPLPAHVRGRCHVRGTFPRAVSRWIERAFGASGRADVLKLLPVEDADAFRADAFNALLWHELEPFDRFLEAAAAELMGGDVTPWRSLALDNFERDLGPILRPSPRVLDARALFERGAAGWARILDFGVVKVIEVEDACARVRVEGFDGASLALRYATLGTMEGLVRAGGASEVSARVLAGEASFTRDFEYEMVWR